MTNLKNIALVLPDIDTVFSDKMLKFLSLFGNRNSNTLQFTKSNSDYQPQIELTFDNVPQPKAIFQSSENTEINIVPENDLKDSPHSYTSITIDNFVTRTKDLKFLGVDHIGFDLPWLKSGIHPDINILRNQLKSTSLYHLFPNGQPWDFILPATPSEIEKQMEVDYSQVRRPKFEIVSLDKTSKPLIQFDILVNHSYELLKDLFPAAIHDPELKNMWVYIQNPYTIDICFVINEHTSGDWSEYFKSSRLI